MRSTNIGDAVIIITGIFSPKSRTIYYDAAVKGEIKVEPGKNRSIELTFKVGKIGKLIELIHVQCNARNAGKKGIYKIVATGKVRS